MINKLKTVLRLLLYTVMLLDAAYHAYTWYPRLHRYLTANAPTLSEHHAETDVDSTDAGEKAEEKAPVNADSEAAQHPGREKKCRTVWKETTCRWIKVP